MSAKFDNILAHIESKIMESSRYGFITSGIELQEEAVENLKLVLAEVRNIKQNFIEEKNEPNANMLLSYELFIESVMFEIKMLINIKKDNTLAAWEDLVNAQGCIEGALRIGFNKEEMMKNYRRKFDYMEKILFPPQVFVSVGFISEESHCSLCDDNYENCDHVKGMAYMGKMCIEIFKKMHKLKEASIVENPADKRCRFEFFNENGKKVDTFTLREIKDEK